MNDVPRGTTTPVEGRVSDVLAKVEAAVRIAAQLGDQAFDYIEGRGLFFLRQEIAESLSSLTGYGRLPVVGHAFESDERDDCHVCGEGSGSVRHITLPVAEMWQAVVRHLAAQVSDGELVASYSGRGMFGASCCGIITCDPDAVEQRAVELGLRDARRDSMGRRTIVYWPSVAEAPSHG